MISHWDVLAWFEHPWVGVILLTPCFDSLDLLIYCFGPSGRRDERSIPCCLPVSPSRKQSVSRVISIKLRLPALEGLLWQFVLFRTCFGMSAPRSHGGWVHLSAWAKVSCSFCILLVKSSDGWTKLTNFLSQAKDAFQSSWEVMDPFSNSLVITRMALEPDS